MNRKCILGWLGLIALSLVPNAHAAQGVFEKDLKCSYGLKVANGNAFGTVERLVAANQPKVDSSEVDKILVVPGSRFGKEGLYIFTNKSAYFKDIDKDYKELNEEIEREEEQIILAKKRVQALEGAFFKKYGELVSERCFKFSSNEKREECIDIRFARSNLSEMRISRKYSYHLKYSYRIDVQDLPGNFAIVRYAMHRDVSPVVTSGVGNDEKLARALSVGSDDLIQDENKTYASKLYGHILHQMSEVDVKVGKKYGDTFLDALKACEKSESQEVASKARVLLCKTDVSGYTGCHSTLATNETKSSSVKNSDSKDLK